MRAPSIRDYQLACPNYLRDVFPRTVSRWHRFSKPEQDQLAQWEKEFVTKELGYTENQDGSFTKQAEVTA